MTASGFGAQPSKPDFAFPKTVSKNAEKELKSAIRRNDGPATVRYLMDYCLAQTRINPERTDAVSNYAAKIQRSVKSPVTKAMIELLRADITDSDSLAMETIHDYSGSLMSAPVGEWKDVINADSSYFPSLYDFGASIAINLGATTMQADSICRLMQQLRKDNPLIACYWAMRSPRSDTQKVYEQFAGTEYAALPLERMAERAYDLKTRKKVYDLCLQWQKNFPNSSFGKDMTKTVENLCRPSLEVSGQSVIMKGAPLKVKVHAECLNAASIEIRQVKPKEKTIATRSLRFAGQGVFQNDTTLEIAFDEYGVYRIVPKFDGMDDRRNIQGFEVSVTDFLLQGTIYAGKRDVYALNPINGGKESGVDITTKDNRYNGKRGLDVYSPALYLWGGYAQSNEWNVQANIVTDRSIYHPGDSLQFAATVMRAKGMERELVTGKSVKIILRNANYQQIDTISLISDKFGRVSGGFLLPKDGLTGYFTLIIAGSSQRFMVTDYKAPTFVVETKAERLNDKQVRVYGSAIGYNGFPIADGEVAVTVKKLPDWVWWWNFRNAGEETLAQDTIQTNTEGKFSVVLDVPTGFNILANASVSSPNGETHDDSGFVPSKPYKINAEVPTYFVPGKAPEISIVNSENNAVNIPLFVELKKDSLTVTPDGTWENVPSGRYILTVKTENPALASEFSSTVTVYRPTDAMPPLETALFVPVTTIDADTDLLIGTSYADSHILYTLWNGKKLIRQEWLTPKAGNHDYRVELPEGIDDATLTLVTMRNYEVYEQNVTVKRPNVARSLNLHIESLRDNMVPGATETWTVKVTDNLGKPASAAVMLDVYCAALDALQPSQWHFNPIYGSGLHFNVNTTVAGHRSSNAYRQTEMPQLFADANAAFNLYGLNWPRLLRMNYMPTNLMVRGSAKVMALDAVAMPEEVTEAVTMDMAAAGVAMDGGAAEQPADDQYRLPDVPVALWTPILETASDGSLQIKFTAPNANTTWRVKALAYDKALLNGLFNADIVCAKPVMVQPQNPRFLRVGDKVQLLSMVMNNTECEEEINAFIEAFDPATDSILSRHDFKLDLAAKQSKLISAEVTAPDATLFGIRVRATAGNFTDGEQTVIPILPASVTVRIGKPFFVPADSTHFTLDVPKGGVVNLTANATWECVTALPGLQTSQSKSAFAQTSALFSAAVARGLLRAHPEIGVALKRWEGSDSVLVSKLMLNSDLKLAVLSSTPWPGAAQSQTERMARLQLLFDSKEVQSTINNAISGLSKLVSNGGFKWYGAASQPSEWVTLTVLSQMAQLKRLGYLPQSKQLNTMLENAVKYLDNEVSKAYAKNKSYYLPEYVLMRSSFSNVLQSAPAKRASSAMVQYTVAHWREFGLQGKARAALLLNANGYASTAKAVLESLRQYEAWNQTGLCPVLLEAFSTIEPNCAEVDEIRRSFIEKKQSMEWGDGLQTSNLIAAILNSGSNWLVPAENELSITVNGKPQSPQLESMIGQTRLTLPEGGKVEISKGHFPAWGGIFSCATDSAAVVKAEGSDKIKISRRLEGDLTLGGKVKLILEIEATQPMDYVLLRSPRCGAMEPVNQIPSTQWIMGLTVYREPCTTVTNWFFNRLAKGKTVVTEEFYITEEGDFIFAPAEIQSQYAPEFQAHSAGSAIITKM